MPLDNSAGSPRLEARLRREIKGEVLFDRFSRGRYATDASIYQIEPLGVVVPRTRSDVAAAIADRARGGRAGAAARRRHLAMRPDGQPRARHRLQQVHERGRRARRRGAPRHGRSPASCWSGSTRRCASTSLFFPVDVSTGDRATIGGMTANNTCGARSIRYGNMVHNVRAIDAILADGTARAFRRAARQFRRRGRARALPRPGARLRALHRREADEIDARFPKLLRRVGGYNIDMIRRCRPQHGASAGRLAKARSPSSPRSSSTFSRSRRTGCSASAISRASTRRWKRPSTSSSWAPRRSSWSTAR